MRDTFQLANFRSKVCRDSRSDNLEQLRAPEEAYLRASNKRADEHDPEGLESRGKPNRFRLMAWRKLPTEIPLDNSRPSLWAKDEDVVTDDRYERIETFKLEDAPKGYPRAAAWINSDIDNGLYRRFGNLHTRALVYKQAELTKLETKLKKLDAEDAGGDNQWKLESYPILGDGVGHDRQRSELMDEIVSKLKEYDKLLLLNSSLCSLKKPSPRIYRYFFNFFFNESLITEEDMQFIFKKDDFVRLTDHDEFSWLDSKITFLMDRTGFKSLFVTKEDENKTSNPYIYYYSRLRLGRVMSTLVAFISTFLLLVPVYLLLNFPLSKPLMATVVLVFVLLCALSLSIFTSAKRYEVFAATAAYSAVLVVFLGNLQKSNIPQ